MFRIGSPSTVDWYDIDFPEVITARQQLLPDRANAHGAGTDLTDANWLDAIPTDRPATTAIGTGVARRWRTCTGTCGRSPSRSASTSTWEPPRYAARGSGGERSRFYPYASSFEDAIAEMGVSGGSRR